MFCGGTTSSSSELSCAINGVPFYEVAFTAGLKGDAPDAAVEMFATHYTLDVLEYTCKEVRDFAQQKGVNLSKLAEALAEVHAIGQFVHG